MRNLLGGAALLVVLAACGDDEASDDGEVDEGASTTQGSGAGDATTSGSVGSGASTGTGGTGAGGGPVLPAPDVTWFDCLDDASSGFSCADVPVPLDWSAPEADSMTVRVYRRAASAAPRGTITMLEGGPGVSGDQIVAFAARTADAHPDLDVLALDHRGTGASGPLRCDEPTDPPSVACLEAWLADDPARVTSTTATAAAFDAAHVARWFGRGADALLYGRSYGTYWAHRAVSVAPWAFDAVALDGPCDAVEGCPAARRDAQTDVPVRALLARCDDDAFCATKLPGGAEAFAAEVVASADRGDCALALDAGIDGRRLRLAIARIAGSHDQRALVPALLHRYARCAAQDGPAFAALEANLALVEEVFPTLPMFSAPTNYHVMRSEFWDATFTTAEAEAQLDATIGASGASHRWAEAFETWPWPVLAPAPELRAWHLDGLPALVLVGGLDVSTPAALVEPLRTQLAPGSTFARLELGGHVMTATPETANGACALAMLDAFLRDPEAPVDTACVSTSDAEEAALLFDESAADAAAPGAFGTSSAYGD